MEAQYKGGDESSNPGAYSYKTLLTMHAKNDRMKLAQRAQQYLDASENKYSHRDLTMKIDLECYQVCVTVWERDGAAEKEK